MFTGIITAIGTVRTLEERGGDVRMYVNTGKLDLSDVQLGDSIATSGVCLTVVALPGDGFVADVSKETLKRTSLADIKTGGKVNLEKAMLPTSRFGGHIVSGHVDGVGRVVEASRSARSWIYRIQAPANLVRYIADKGSITVDGVSLTVNAVESDVFSLNIVPHTAQETIISQYRPGTSVNLEVDIIARYLERLMTIGADGQPLTSDSGASTGSSKLSEAFLAEHGFFQRG